jgi:hypothetical protein
VSTPNEHDSERVPQSRTIRASCLRGMRLGAIVGAVFGIVAYLGTFFDLLRIAWRPGYTSTMPLWVLATRLSGVVLLGALIMAAFGSAIGAVLLGIFAVLKRRRQRIV